MVSESSSQDVIVDLDVRRKFILRLGGVFTALGLSTVAGGIIGHDIASNNETDQNKAEAEQSAAVLRCAAFVSSHTVEPGKPVIIRASDLSKQQRDDCGAPDPVEKDSDSYGFYDGKITEEDYELQMPSVTELEKVADEKERDSTTSNEWSIGASTGAGALGGFVVSVFGLSGAIGIQNNRRRNGGNSAMEKYLGASLKNGRMQPKILAVNF